MLPPKLILSPIDFSEPSLEALDAAIDIASRYNAGLLLEYVVPVIPRLPDAISILKEGDYERELIKNAEERLTELAKKVTEKGLSVRTSVGLANDAAMEIIRAADHENVDLIVIATHGMTGWRRLAFGSVTEKVVRTANCPVLVLRKNQAGESSEHEAKASAAAAPSTARD
jgi:nucleotide-binding universal stress UspA family protein